MTLFRRCASFSQGVDIERSIKKEISKHYILISDITLLIFARYITTSKRYPYHRYLTKENLTNPFCRTLMANVLIFSIFWRPFGDLCNAKNLPKMLSSERVESTAASRARHVWSLVLEQAKHS